MNLQVPFYYLIDLAVSRILRYLKSADFSQIQLLGKSSWKMRFGICENWGLYIYINMQHTGVFQGMSLASGCANSGGLKHFRQLKDLMLKI